MPTLNLPSRIYEDRSKILKDLEARMLASKPEPSRTNLKDKTVLVFDHGLQVETAARLARDFKKVYYYSSWEDALPRSNKALIGSGFDGIERILHFWDYVDKVDLICSFDTHSSDIVQYLRNKGYRVWGAGKSEILEHDRWKFRQIQKAIGLPSQPTDHIIGLDNLIQYLKTHEDKWIKTNQFRGDIETFHHSTFDETQNQFLGKLLHSMGAKGSSVEFTIESPIEGVECGYDGWVIDGKYPKTAMYGYEDKDTGYVGRVSTYNNLPEPIKNVNDKLVSVFKKLGGRTLFSTEVRIGKDGIGYLTDPTVRAAMPMMSAIQVELFKNFSEIIWEGAGGNIIEPKTTAVYAAGVALESEWAKENWTLIEFPKEVRPWVKLRMAMKKDGKYYGLPGFSSLGSVIGLGNTLQEAIDKVKENVSKVKAKELWYQTGSLDKLKDEVIPQGRKNGIKF